MFKVTRDSAEELFVELYDCFEIAISNTRSIRFGDFREIGARIIDEGDNLTNEGFVKQVMNEILQELAFEEWCLDSSGTGKYLIDSVEESISFMMPIIKEISIKKGRYSELVELFNIGDAKKDEFIDGFISKYSSLCGDIKNYGISCEEIINEYIMRAVEFQPLFINEMAVEFGM